MVHEGINMRLVLSHIFLPNKNMFVIGRKDLLTILFGNKFKGVNNDKTVPHKRVNLPFS